METALASKSFENEIKELIIEALALEEISPAEIEAAAPLFVEGLGLDSIDALELAMVLEERYGVQIGEDEDLNRQIFASLRDLASYVDENRAPSP
jgi:acyl carrier protein